MNTSERPERIRLMDTFRNLFYTPIYVAVAGGFLYKQGLDVLFGTVPTGKQSVQMLKDGEVDIVQTGISRSLMDLDDGHEDAPLHIAEINQRDGFFLVSKNPTDDWSWRQVEGTTVIPVGFTPVPWMSLKAVLKKHDVSLDKVRLLEGLSAEDAIATFRRGEADYLQMVNPQAQQLVEDGDGFLAAAMGPELGYICYSSFAVTPQFVEQSPHLAQRFVSGFYDALQWLAGNDVDAVAKTVSPFFPNTPESVLRESIRRYKSQDTWPHDPLIGPDGYDSMRDLLIDGGLVKSRHAYDRLVRPEFARTALEN